MTNLDVKHDKNFYHSIKNDCINLVRENYMNLWINDERLENQLKKFPWSHHQFFIIKIFLTNGEDTDGNMNVSKVWSFTELIEDINLEKMKTKLKHKPSEIKKFLLKNTNLHLILLEDIFIQSNLLSSIVHKFNLKGFLAYGMIKSNKRYNWYEIRLKKK